MSQATADRPCIAERYIHASNSRNLSLQHGRRTDADVLLAAGYTTARNEMAALALRFYRLKAAGDMTEFGELAQTAGKWLQGRSRRKARKPMGRLQATDLARRAMFWWLNPVCKPCDGHGHPKMPNSPVINVAHKCGVCHGTGQYPIHRVVPIGTADEAKWLVDELDRYCRLVFDDMARRLSLSIDL